MSDATWVKICGLTRPLDVETAIASGADAIGLVLVARSPRRVDPQRASELATIAADRATVVALVEGDAAAAIALARRIGANGVQPYGPHAADIARSAMSRGLEVLFPVGVPPDEPIDLADLPAGARPLLDTKVAGETGGTGSVFFWERALSIPAPVIAGGLHPGNVAAAIAAAQPWGVDASSGLEAEVGIKDPVKVASFVAAAKKA